MVMNGRKNVGCLYILSKQSWSALSPCLQIQTMNLLQTSMLRSVYFFPLYLLFVMLTLSPEIVFSADIMSVSVSS